MNRPAWPEKGSGVRNNEVGAFICSPRPCCSKWLTGLLELAGAQPQKFEMRPVWGPRNIKEGMLKEKVENRVFGEAPLFCLREMKPGATKRSHINESGPNPFRTARSALI
jgi:hypothetical protein